jgi:hypothetical protein
MNACSLEACRSATTTRLVSCATYRSVRVKRPAHLVPARLRLVSHGDIEGDWRLTILSRPGTLLATSSHLKLV